MTEKTRKSLRQRTGVAAAKTARARRVLAERRGEPIAPGDLLVTASNGPIRWGVVDRAAAEVLVVPVDAMSWAHADDLPARELATDSPLVLRCAHCASVQVAVFEPPMRAGSLAADTVVAARRRCARSEADRPSDPFGDELDHDPEYLDWIDEVVRPARTALLRASALAKPAADLLTMPKSAASDDPPTAVVAVTKSIYRYRLAATALLAISLGLAGGLYSIRGDRAVQVARLGAELAAARAKEKLLQQRLDGSEAMSAAVSNVQLVLLDEPRMRSASSEPPAERVSGEPPRFTLAVAFREGDPTARYSLKLYSGSAGSAGEPDWTATGLVLQEPLLLLSTEVPTARLAPGVYRVEIHDAESGVPVKVFQRRLELVDPALRQ